MQKITRAQLYQKFIKERNLIHLNNNTEKYHTKRILELKNEFQLKLHYSCPSHYAQIFYILFYKINMQLQIAIPLSREFKRYFIKVEMCSFSFD